MCFVFFCSARCLDLALSLAVTDRPELFATVAKEIFVEITLPNTTID